MFCIIPDAVIISCCNGIYRQHKVYQHKNRVFIGHGGGYVYIHKNGGTSAPRLRIDELELPFKPTYNSLGYLVVPEDKGTEK